MGKYLDKTELVQGKEYRMVNYPEIIFIHVGSLKDLLMMIQRHNIYLKTPMTFYDKNGVPITKLWHVSILDNICGDINLFEEFNLALRLKNRGLVVRKYS